MTDLKPAALADAPAALPGSLGMELLARRPDLQAAHWRVEASLNRIDSSQGGVLSRYQSDGFRRHRRGIAFNQLLKYPSRTLSIGPALSLPLFDGGRLKADLGTARSARNEMIADYNQSVFKAVRDVAQAAVSLQGLQKQIAEQESSSTATKALLNGAQARFKQGLVDNSALLAAELSVDRQLDAALQLKALALQGDVSLMMKALGGGYPVRMCRRQPSMALLRSINKGCSDYFVDIRVCHRVGYAAQYAALLTPYQYTQPTIYPDESNKQTRNQSRNTGQS